MLREFLISAEDRSIYSKYRDPQEFMWGDEREDASDVYSLGMFLFSCIAGKDYFEYINIPADEYFMMADTDGDNSVIDEKYIPEKYVFLADILKKMTVYRRDRRISSEKALDEIRKFADSESTDEDLSKADEILKTDTINNSISNNSISATSEISKTDTVENLSETSKISKTDTGENLSEASEISENKDRSECFSESLFSVLEKDFDYGIILNNKRSGRIEFRVLYDVNGNGTSCDIPVMNSGIFRIAVSKRHRNFAHISNPSSIYGDNIIPVGIAEADGVTEGKVRVSLDNKSGEIAVLVAQLDMNGNDTGKNITVKWGDMNVYR